MDNSWSLVNSSMRQSSTPRSLTPGTVPRIIAFAKPHRRLLLVFLALSTVSAVLTVATPLLAGRVVNAIVGHAGVPLVVGLAVLIALLTVIDSGIGLASRWQSSRIGEGLILDLRRAVFDHVQRMPVAFFTRTRTGALVSRLNNDVIGAQNALTSTLSGVVTNVIQLALTLAVMLALSWQVTILALVLLPIFVLPARRMGAR
ncbi:MAG: ABC transporter transmembrane domain-containing protein, partial [Pseudonocardiaceae bacterium]